MTTERQGQEEVEITTNRFATTAFARLWAERAMSAASPVYRSIGEPYHEGVVEHAPVAVDCERVVSRATRSP